MVKQLVNTGSAANDGTGDTLRTAFNKVNDNTNELYSALFTNNNLLTFKEWLPNTSYNIGEVFYITVENSKLFLQVTNSYTSNSFIPDALDTTNTFLVGQSTAIINYPAEGVRIPAGTLYSGDGSLWQSSQSFTAGEAGFNFAEQATNWTQITTAGLPGTSWVEAERGINSSNPFSSILPKVDGSGSPYVWRFNAGGPVALDNTTIIGVKANRDRLWYHPSNDTWFHEKDPLTFQGANFTNAGTEGILPVPQQNDVYRSITGGGNWLFPFQMADTYPAPYVNEIHMGQGCVIKDGEIYELVADGDRSGVRLIPETTWASAPVITGKTYNSNIWTVTGQPTSGTHECFVYANYDTFTWEFRTRTSNSNSDNYIGATSTTSGVAGLVPPATSLASERLGYLRGDGAWIKTFTVDAATLLFTNVTSVRGTPHTSSYFAQPDINGNTICTTSGYYQVIVTFSSSEPAGTNVQLYLDYLGGNFGWINKANFNLNFTSTGTGTLSVALTEYFEVNSSAFRLRTNLNVAGGNTLTGNRNILALIKKLDN